MSTPESQKSPIQQVVTPHLVCADAAAAIDFYRKAFGAEEVVRLPGPGGKLVHAAVRIEGAMVMLTDENPEWGNRGPRMLGGSPVTIHLQVPDADAFVARAEQAGAKVLMPVQEMFWGDRYGQLEDPSGHRWSVGTTVRHVDPADYEKAMKASMG